MAFFHNLESLISSDGIGQIVVVAGFALILVLVSYMLLIWLTDNDAVSAEFRIPLVHFKIRRRNQQQKKPKGSSRLAVQHKWEKFGVYLRALRLDKGVSENILGLGLNMTRSEVLKLEMGDIQPTSELIEDIAICLGLTERESRVLQFLALEAAA